MAPEITTKLGKQTHHSNGLAVDFSAKFQDLPQLLFRAFTQRAFAEEFVEGRFRLGSLACYKNTTDAPRRDTSEGTASYKDVRGLETTTINGNIFEQYVLCCSTGDVDIGYLRNKMGEHIVKIYEPSVLVKEIESFLVRHGVPTLNGLHGCLVEYSKGEVQVGELNSSENFDLSLRQKPRAFEEEHEYRLFAILRRQGSPLIQGTHLHIDLDRRLKCAEIVL